MIESLDLTQPATADQVLGMQHAAYRMQADLIGFDGIPLLHETLEQLIAEPLDWRGIRDGGRVVAAIAIAGAGGRCDVDRLMVDPQHQRRGYGRRLMQSVMMHESVTVSTGEANFPAVMLCASLGFRRIGSRQIATDVWTVQFEFWHDHLKASFDRDVAGYETARPGYPDELFDMLVQSCALGPRCRVLEIGSGPGQATMELLGRGASVVAVEPGAGMVARLRERVAGRPCQVIQADFEDATVTGSFDLAVAATSFHWVDPAVGISKLAALVAPAGWLALWWNVFRDVGPNDAAFAERLRPISQRFQTAERMDSIIYAQDEPQRRAEIEAGGHFAVERIETFEWPMRHDGGSLRGLFASFSDWSTLPEPDRSMALDDIAAIVDDHFGGVIDRRYITVLYIARRR